MNYPHTCNHCETDDCRARLAFHRSIQIDELALLNVDWLFHEIMGQYHYIMLLYRDGLICHTAKTQLLGDLRRQAWKHEIKMPEKMRWK